MALFQPIKVGHMELAHRVVLAPLTRRRASDSGVPADYAKEYYGQRAEEPGSLLITEATPISDKAGGVNNVPGIWTQAQADGWKPIVETIHDKKSYAFMQLWSIGRKANPEIQAKKGYDVVGPSSIPLDEGMGWGAVTPRALTVAEIKEFIESFKHAAKLAVNEVGFDGVEIHMANGYLVEQFLRSVSNNRTDAYGGSVEYRARFAIEVLDAVVSSVGDAARVAVRLSPWTRTGGMKPDEWTVAEYSFLLGYIQSKYPDLAYISLVEPRVSLGHFDFVSVSSKPGLDLDEWNKFVRLTWEGPIIRAGALIDHPDKIADKDPRTLVAIGRYFISNPDLVSRLRKKEELTPYDRETFYTGGKKGYIDYKSFT